LKHIFHVHTYRCKHASNENDEAYIKTALMLGADKITFTDHSPFPGDLFKNRMNLSQLDEYINSLKILKSKYKNQIDIEIGLEAEYLPSMTDFYKHLKSNPDLQILILGQHFYEHTDGRYSFNDDNAYNVGHYKEGRGNAIIAGIKSGLFSVVAHPDRIFRHIESWTVEDEKIAMKIIQTASEYNISLERNLSSYEKNVLHHGLSFWKDEFWDLVSKYNSENENKVRIIEGLDAHSTDEMISREKYMTIF